MSAEYMQTYIRTIQSYSQQQDTNRLLSAAVSLLISLNNEFNVKTLTNQILLAPAFWNDPHISNTSLSIISVFHTTTRAIILHHVNGVSSPSNLSNVNRNVVSSFRQSFFHDLQSLDSSHVKLSIYPSLFVTTRLSLQSWILAAVNGANERVPPPRYLLVLAGIILGYHDSISEVSDIHLLPLDFLRQIRIKFVKSINTLLASLSPPSLPNLTLSYYLIPLILNLVYSKLSPKEHGIINFSLLLPLTLHSLLFSPLGFQSAYVIGTIQPDILHLPDDKLSWPATSQSCRQISLLLKQPLITSIGSYVRLISESIRRASDPKVICHFIIRILDFSRALLTQWRLTKFSNISFSAHQDSLFFDSSSLTDSIPVLNNLLKTIFFSLVYTLSAFTSRILVDSKLSSKPIAHTLSYKIMLILRNIFFITNRLQTDTFTYYQFVYQTSVGVLSSIPSRVDSILLEFAPSQSSPLIDATGLEKCFNLFFLNVVEHFSLYISEKCYESTVLPILLNIFSTDYTNHSPVNLDAAHSTTVAVLTAARSNFNSTKSRSDFFKTLIMKFTPIYLDSLLREFPCNISLDMLTFATKNLVYASLIDSTLKLPTVILDALRDRAEGASSIPPDVSSDSSEPVLLNDNPNFTISPKAGYTLALISSLPILPSSLVDTWVQNTISIIAGITYPPGSFEACRDALWKTMVCCSDAESPVTLSRVNWATQFRARLC